MSTHHEQAPLSPPSSLKHDDDKAIALATIPSVVPTVLEHGISLDADATHLAALGYQQELKRSIGLLGILSMSFAILSVPSGMFTTLIYGLVAGGPAALLYNWILVTFTTLSVILSLAEICSVYPTAGSVYYWSAILAGSDKSARPLSWITGWLNGIGELFGVCAIAFSESQVIFSVVTVWHPTFQPARYQVVLLYWVCLFSAVMANIPAAKGRYMTHVASTGAIITVLGILIIVPTLLGTSTHRNDAKYVFGSFTTMFSGYPSAWSWLLASLTPTYAMIASCNITSLCEEVRHPETEVPRAMWMPVVMNALIGFLMLIGICYVLPDVGALLSDPSGQPAAGLFLAVTSSKIGATLLTLLVIVATQFCGIGSAACLSRFIYGFARDGAIPGHKWLARIHPTLQIPLNALMAQTIVAALVGLIYIGSTAAFNAFVGSAIACLACAFCVPIGALLAHRRAPVKNAPFSLGRFGYAVNVLSIAWCILLSVLCCSPLSGKPTAATMNYAAVCLVFFAAVSAGWYVVWGRKNFVGPNVKAGFH